MKKKKLWLSIVAAVLLLVTLGGVCAALIPSVPLLPTDTLLIPDECPHEYAKLIKEDVYDEYNATFLYYCSDCDSRFERIMIEDCFVNNLPEVSEAGVAFFGNWEVGNYDSLNQYKRFDGVYVDNTLSQGTTYWLRLDGYNMWSQTSGFNPYCPAETYNHRIGVGRNGNDCAIVWTAPRDGEIVFGATDFTLKNSSDAYNFVVEHNDKQVFPSSGKLPMSQSDIGDDAAFEREFAGITLSVKAGDRIYFRASRVSDDTSGTNESFMPSVTYVDHVLHFR